MRNRTLKKIGGMFKWSRSGDVNKTLKSIKMDIDSRCNRKLANLNKMCESRGYNPYIDLSYSSLDPYSSIKDALIGKNFYYISPKKRKFIFKMDNSQNKSQKDIFRSKYQTATILITDNENFEYVFFANRDENKNKLSDYDVNIENPNFIISCNMFGLIPADVIKHWNNHIDARFLGNSTTHIKKQVIS